MKNSNSRLKSCQGAEDLSHLKCVEKKSLLSKKGIKWGVIAVTALFSGFCNAAIGAGGGIVLTFALAACLSERFSDRRSILATSQAAMIPGCLLSALIYYGGGGLDLSNFAVFAIPALLGGALGSFLLNRIKPGLINVIFSALVIFSGFRMVR